MLNSVTNSRLIERALEWWEDTIQKEPTTLTGLLELVPVDLRRASVLFKYDWAKEDFLVQEMGDQVLFYSQRQVVGMTATEAYGPASESVISSELMKVRKEGTPSICSVSYVGPVGSVTDVTQVIIPISIGGAATDYSITFVEFNETQSSIGVYESLNGPLLFASLTLVNVIVSLLMFNYLNNISQQQLDLAEATVADSISAELSEIERSLSSVSAVIEAAGEIDEVSYLNIVSGILNPLGSQRSVRAVAFAPEIGTDSSLPDFDELVKRFVRDGSTEPQDWPESAPDRGFPALFTWPTRANEEVLGFDLWTERTRRQAAQASIAEGGVATSAPLILTQDMETGTEVSTLAVNYSPFSIDLLGRNGARTTVSAWAIASGVSLGFAIENALGEVDATVNVSVRDLGPASTVSLADTGTPVYQDSVSGSPLRFLSKQSTRPLDFGKRTYLIETTLVPGRAEIASVTAPFLFFGLGLIITVLLTMSLSRAARRRKELEDLVEGRTSQIKQLNKILIERSQELSLSEAAKTRLLSTLSHELRTPLNGVVGFTDLLLNTFEKLTDERRKDYLASVADAGGHLKAVVDRFLATTSALPVEHELQIEKVQLSDYFNWIDDLFAPQAAEYGIALEIDAMSWDGIVIEVDRTAFTQIITNILDNAIKFTPSGKTIRIEWRWIGDRGALVVADQGVGMSPQQIQSLDGDSLVASATPVHGTRGLGLGLSLTKSLASLIGIKLLISSTLGNGTSVQLVFASDKWQMPPLN